MRNCNFTKYGIGGLTFTVLILLFLEITVHSGFAQSNLTNSSLPANATETYSNLSPIKISGDYTNNATGFHIKLPEGWTGFAVPNFVVASPAGFSLKDSYNFQPIKSGPMDNVTIYANFVGDESYYLNKVTMSDYNASSYEDFVKKKAEGKGCKVISDTYVKVNGINSEKTTQECEYNVKKIEYLFASDKSLAEGYRSFVWVGFAGTAAGFDYNLPKFEQSLQTIKIDEPRDVQADITELINK